MRDGRCLGLARAARPVEAADAAARARHSLDTYGERFAAPVVGLAEAVVAAARGDDGAHVAELLSQALAIAERQGALAIAAHIHTTTAELLGMETAATLGES
jgi:hypothetical protein